MGYAELCEYYAGMGLSGSDAAHYAGSGVRPDFVFEEDEPDDKDYASCVTPPAEEQE